VARKQIELATCGLRQITAKLWKFFFGAERWNKRPSLHFSVVCEIATVQERLLCVGWLFETKSVTQTQRNYLETGSVHDCKRSGRAMNVWKQSVHRLYEALQNPHVELRVNCYSHVQGYTKCYIIHNFLKPRVDFPETLYN
jgi:hypothetical protein